MIFDTHAHYNLTCFDQNREVLFQKMKEAGVEKVLCPSISFEENQRMLDTLAPYGQVLFAVGIHPTRTPLFDWSDGYMDGELRRLAARPRVAAIGELGLDYHRGLENHPDLIARERCWFQRQLNIASDLELPLVLHIRSSPEHPHRAYRDALEILRAQPRAFSGVLHCYNSDYETACRFLEGGDYRFGIGGCLTYEGMDHLRQAVAKLPLERILLETDAPFLPPRGCPEKRNTSLNLPAVIQLIAELKHCSPETVEQTTFETAEQLFCRHLTERS